MNNQAAQTMPELPEPTMRELNPYHGSRIDPYSGATHLQWYTADQMHQYARDYAAALSQTAGVAHRMTGVPDKDGREICAGDLIVYRNASQYTKEEYWNPEYIVEWKAPAFVLRHVGGGKDDSNASFAFNVAVRDPYWAIKLETIAAAPSASGGEDGWSLAMRVREALDRASCPDHFMRIAVETITGDAPQPPAAASVSERARAIITETIGYEFGTGSLQPVNDHDMGNLAAAIEQALAQQRGEAVARVIFTNRKKPDVEWLTDTVKRDTLLYTTPQPSADAVRELAATWRKRAERKRFVGLKNEALLDEAHANELESLLGRGGK